jgi:hypothetical protein
MTRVKAFGILVEARGEGVRIAGIADVARNRTKPAQTCANLCPSTRTPRADEARLGWLGMTAGKCFGILVDGWGEGWKGLNAEDRRLG